MQSQAECLSVAGQNGASWRAVLGGVCRLIHCAAWLAGSKKKRLGVEHGEVGHILFPIGIQPMAFLPACAGSDTPAHL